MKIYFAGSIRGGRDDNEIYFKIIEMLAAYGTVLTEHIGSKDLSSDGEALSGKNIYARDMAWLTEADAVVAEVTMPSLGVGYEIAKAEDMAKPTLCLYRPSEHRKLSAMIAGNGTLINKEYRDLSEAEAIIKNFFENI